MKTFLRSLVVIVAASAAFAPSTRAQTDSLLFVSGSGVGYNGVQVGPYRGMLISEPGTPTVDIYCVDYMHEITVGTRWKVYDTNLGGGNLSNTRLFKEFTVAGNSWYGSANVLTRYEEAAWLTTQFSSNNKSSWGAIHSAIWLLTTPNFGTNLPSGLVIADTYNWVNLAAADYTQINPNSYEVLTDVRVDANGNGGVQEYLMVTPEPETVLLLASGLGALYAMRRRRREQEVS
jgi:hypothetical protein